MKELNLYNLNKILKKNLKTTRHSNKRVQSRTELYFNLTSLRVFKRYRCYRTLEHSSSSGSTIFCPVLVLFFPATHISEFSFLSSEKYINLKVQKASYCKCCNLDSLHVLTLQCIYLTFHPFITAVHLNLKADLCRQQYNLVFFEGFEIKFYSNSHWFA